MIMAIYQGSVLLCGIGSDNFDPVVEMKTRRELDIISTRSKDFRLATWNCLCQVSLFTFGLRLNSQCRVSYLMQDVCYCAWT